MTGVTPSGNVSYTFFDNDACTGSGTPAGTETLASGSAPQSDTLGPLAAGKYSFDATYSGDNDYIGSTSSCEPVTVGQATPSTAITVFDADTNAAWSGMETANARAYGTATVTGAAGVLPTGTVTYTFFTASSSCSGTGTSAGTVTVSGGTVPQSTTTGHLGVGAYSICASYSGDSNYVVDELLRELQRRPGPPNPPTINDIPGSPVYGSSFVASVTTNSDGSSSVTSSTAGVCTANGTGVKFVGVGTCTLTAHTSAPNFAASNGAPQNIAVGLATPMTPVIVNIPSRRHRVLRFLASVVRKRRGATSVASSITAVCSVGTNGHTVSFVGFGACTLTASVAQGPHLFGATGSTQTFPVARPPMATGWWALTEASSPSAPPPSTAPWEAPRCSDLSSASRRRQPQRLLARRLRRRNLQLR